LKKLTKKPIKINLNSLTKNQLLKRLEWQVEKLKSQFCQIADCEEVMEGQQEEVTFLMGVLRRHGLKIRTSSDVRTSYSADDEEIIVPTDGTISCEGLRLFIKAGSTEADMDALMKVGDKMIRWLEKKGIELDGNSSPEAN
jgi:hypothetical protein